MLIKIDDELVVNTNEINLISKHGEESIIHFVNGSTVIHSNSVMDLYEIIYERIAISEEGIDLF